MLRRNRTAVWLFALVMILVIAACASNPTNRWAQARVALTRGQNMALVAHQAGMVDDTALVSADTYVKSARVALDSAEDYLPEGGDLFNMLMDMADSIILELESVTGP